METAYVIKHLEQGQWVEVAKIIDEDETSAFELANRYLQNAQRTQPEERYLLDLAEQGQFTMEEWVPRVPHVSFHMSHSIN